ncbi:MAG TPA: glutamate--cysteine ligase [Porticoccaceae bacterium]|nr:glutamate--cysteine ligase [Porticoccaceae bacterium]
MSSLNRRLSLLARPGHHESLTGIRRGIEKESLRVTPEGELSQRPHPRALGSTLTHPNITTDFSEALLEFITPPLGSVPEVLQSLEDIHRFTYSNIGDELLWVNSMPCVLGRDEDIPLAEYGSSNIGQMKKIYRRGLGKRYGRLMQTIAGIHYNWSLPDACWELLKTDVSYTGTLQDYKTEGYFGLIRNFRRHFWLLLYLFGGAPAVCRSFVAGRQHQLQPFNGDNHSLHMPHATSLRMGDLGYQSKAQEALVVCYNSLTSYIENLRQALTETYPPYEKIGIRDPNGKYLQLNTHLLQIENEFYSTIRPKRTTESGEAPIQALWQRGIEYIEVRCIDLNPYAPLGIDAEQMYFTEVFLLHCLLSESPATDDFEYRQLLDNQHRTVYQGRDPALALLRGNDEIPLRSWAEQLFGELEDIADLLDMNMSHGEHRRAIDRLKVRLEDPQQTPAARLLAEMETSGATYFQTALGHARQQRAYFLDKPLTPALISEFQQLAEQSRIRQANIESIDKSSFEEYLATFYAQYNFPLS